MRWNTDSVSALCGRLPSDGDPFLDLLPLKAAAGSSRPGDPDAKPLPQCATARDPAGGDALSHRRDRRPGRGHSCLLPSLVVVGAYGGLRMGELPGSAKGGVDLLAGAVTVAEILTEVKAG